MEFEINDADGKIKGREDKLYKLIQKFLVTENYGRAPKKQETQQSGYGKLDVHVIDENERKIGVEAKPYFSIAGAQGEAAFGQALLRKKRNDVEKMFVAFPMSKCKGDNEKLIRNFNTTRLQKFQGIWENLGLSEENEIITNFSTKEINERIYKKAYSCLGIGLLGIMGRVKDGRFVLEKDPVEELYSPQRD